MNAAKGDTASAEAQLSYTKIISPIDGVVTDRPFIPAKLRPAGSPIITVMDLVPGRRPRARRAAGSGQPESGRPGDDLVPGQARTVKGKVTLVSPAVDPNSTTVEVWVQAPNPKESLQAGNQRARDHGGETVPHADCDSRSGPADDPDGVNIRHRAGHRQRAHKKKVKVGIRDRAKTCKSPTA